MTPTFSTIYTITHESITNATSTIQPTNSTTLLPTYPPSNSPSVGSNDSSILGALQKQWEKQERIEKECFDMERQKEERKRMKEEREQKKEECKRLER